MKFKHEIKWALIYAGCLLFWMLIERLVGLHDQHIDKHFWVTNLFGLVAFAVYFLAIREKKKTFFQGQMTWAQGVLSGLLLTLFVVLLAPLYQYIITTVITPDYFDHAIDYAVSTGRATRAKAEAYFNLSNYVLLSVMSASFLGVVFSAVVPLFLRSNP